MTLHSLPRRVGLGLATALALYAGAAIADTASPGITDTAIKIGVTTPVTGPVAAVGQIAEGIKMRVNAVNAAGGVKMGDGKTRKIELTVLDDGIDPQRTLNNARKLVEQTGVFALLGTAGTPNNQAIGRYLVQKQVPDLFMYSGVHELGEGEQWMIGLAPSFTTEAAVFAEYLKLNKPQAKVAMLYLNTETGQTFQAAFKGAIQGSKVQLVATQPVTAMDPTVDTQMSSLKASGADTLVIITAPRQGAQGVRFAAESGWNPTTLVSYIASSVAALKPAGLSNAKGVITSMFMKPIDAPALAGDPGVRRYLADHDAARPRFEKDDAMGQMGYLTAEALVHVLEKMKQPTREAMMQAATHLDKAELGLLLSGIRLSTNAPADVYPIETLQLFQFDGERYKALGGLISFEGKTPKHN